MSISRVTWQHTRQLNINRGFPFLWRINNFHLFFCTVKLVHGFTYIYLPYLMIVLSRNTWCLESRRPGDWYITHREPMETCKGLGHISTDKSDFYGCYTTTLTDLRQNCLKLLILSWKWVVRMLHLHNKISIHVPNRKNNKISTHTCWLIDTVGYIRTAILYTQQCFKTTQRLCYLAFGHCMYIQTHSDIHDII